MCKTCGKVKNGDIKAKTEVFAGGLPGLGWVWRNLKTCVKWLKRMVWRHSVQGKEVVSLAEFETLICNKIWEGLDPAKTPTAAVKGRGVPTIEAATKAFDRHEQFLMAADTKNILHRAPANQEELEEKRVILFNQLKEMRAQGSWEIRITCPCCRKRIGLHFMYKCLYCGIYFCRVCAAVHFENPHKKSAEGIDTKAEEAMLDMELGPKMRTASADPLGAVLGEIGRQMAAEDAQGKRVALEADGSIKHWTASQVPTAAGAQIHPSPDGGGKKADIDSLSQKVKAGGMLYVLEIEHTTVPLYYKTIELCIGGSRWIFTENIQEALMCDHRDTMEGFRLELPIQNALVVREHEFVAPPQDQPPVPEACVHCGQCKYFVEAEVTGGTGKALCCRNCMAYAGGEKAENIGLSNTDKMWVYGLVSTLHAEAHQKLTATVKEIGTNGILTGKNYTGTIKEFYHFEGQPVAKIQFEPVRCDRCGQINEHDQFIQLGQAKVCGGCYYILLMQAKPEQKDS